ncbi:unnamed protein product [Rangifer tarandus platyrhynchus]|uniref:Uncharacterized protein n=1 Tax=Rangifer tarandus platyrhynchus TaxID=3082113 RepID=A0AC59Y3N1_RANTA
MASARSAAEGKQRKSQCLRVPHRRRPGRVRTQRQRAPPPALSAPSYSPRPRPPPGPPAGPSLCTPPLPGRGRRLQRVEFAGGEQPGFCHYQRPSRSEHVARGPGQLSGSNASRTSPSPAGGPRLGFAEELARCSAPCGGNPARLAFPPQLPSPGLRGGCAGSS